MGMYSRTKMSQKLTSVFLSILLACSFMPMYASTASADEVEVDGTVTTGMKIEESGVYKIEDGSTYGTIEIGEDIEVTLVGNGIGTADDSATSFFTDLNIIVGDGSSLTIQDVRIYLQTNSSDPAIEFEGDGNLFIEGTNLIDRTVSGGSLSSIHIPYGTSVTLDGNGTLYAYKTSLGSLIGSNANEAHGDITFNGGTWFLKGSQTGAVIGGDNPTEGEMGDITINDGELYVTTVSRAAAIGASSQGYAPDIYINGGLIAAHTDWWGSTVGLGGVGTEDMAGDLVITGGSLKSIIFWNAFSSWGIESSADYVISDLAITNNMIDADGNSLALLTLSSQLPDEDNYVITIDGNEYYNGPTYSYSWLEDTDDFTPYNWIDTPDDTLYLRISKEDHTILINGIRYDCTWNEDTETFSLQYVESDTSWYDESADEYVIEDSADLMGFAELVNAGNDFTGKTLSLARDISLSRITNWTPIGGENTVFNGTFDGEGYTISNLTIESRSGYQALFGQTGADAVIKNFSITGSVTSTVNEGDYVAAVVAYNGGEISNVHSTVDVTASSAYNVGGIAGFNDGGYNAAISTSEPTGLNGVIKECSVNANVIGYGKVGGIVGENSGTIDRCAGLADSYVYSNEVGRSGVGGIVGRNGNNNAALEEGKISNCYFIGTVGNNNGRWVGGIVGFNNSLSTVVNCYMAGTLLDTSYGNYNAVIGTNENGTDGGVANNYAIEGIEGTGSTEDETGIATSEDDFKSEDMIAKLGEAYSLDVELINDGFPILDWQVIYVDLSDLEAAIDTAIEELASASASEDGTDVRTDAYWVSQSIYDALEAALVEAQTVYNNEYASLAEVDTATTALNAAIGAFQAAKQYGTYIYKADLQAAVDAATNAMNSTAVSLDGSDVSTDEQWVSIAVAMQLSISLGTAQTVLANTNVTQSQVDAATATLEAAIATFEAAKQYGTATGTGTDSGTGSDSGTGTGSGSGSTTTKEGWTRLYGDTRYETMAAVVQETFENNSSDYVVIASGNSYADALSATSLAGVLDAPIILVNTNDITDSARTEIERVGASYAYIIGGTSAISDTVESQVEQIVGSGNVDRLYGNNRMLTAIEVANETYEICEELGIETTGQAIIATGYGYADALSISPYAYSTATPIYLAGSDGLLDSQTLSSIQNLGIDDVIIVGGTSVVSDSVRTQLGSSVSTDRLYGDNRYATSVAVANWAITNGYLSANNAAVATGTNYPDALSVSALCGQKGSVLLLATDGQTSTATQIVQTYADSITKGYFIGGEGVISSSVVMAFERASGMFLD